MTPTKTSKKGFTIIELLTVLSIIIILISILVPSLNRARIFAKKVTQKGQFHEISKGLELFRNDHQETYPDSGAVDADPAGPFGYCGAMKLCEAMLGQDGMGFHPSSKFYANATTSGPDPAHPDIYPFDLCVSTDPSLLTGSPPPRPDLVLNLRERSKYLESDNVKASRLADMYTWPLNGNGASFYDSVSFQDTPATYHNAVITDVYLRPVSRCGGVKVGMPVLYYKADPSKQVHDVNFVLAVGTPNPNIYNFDDNYGLTALGCPWEPAANVNPHPMFTDPRIFYSAITNKKVVATPRPHNEDGYILISAGYDGLYGTRDDVFNFAD